MNKLLYKLAAKYEEDRVAEREADPDLPENADIDDDEEEDEVEKRPKTLRELSRREQRKIKRKTLRKKMPPLKTEEEEKLAFLMKLAKASPCRLGNPVYNLRANAAKRQKPSIGLPKLIARRERLAELLAKKKKK